MNDTERDAARASFGRRSTLALADVYDALTRLPGRRAAFAMLARATVLADRIGQDIMAILIDLDRFYIVNETKGTAFGDEMLRQIAGRLRRLEPWSDHVCRLGGNTFLLFRLIDKGAEQRDIDALAQVLKQEVEERLLVRGQAAYPFCSVGISRYPADGETAELILRHADTALRQAKASGGNRIAAYTEGVMPQVRRMEQLRGALRYALSLQELSLHYQPLYENTGRLRGFEALLRWRHKDLGEISPAEFIPLAEQSGQIVSIGEWVIGEACGMLQRARAKGMHGLVISVNLSPLQLRIPGFPEKLQGILDESGTKPECLELEITESMMIDADDCINAVLWQLRDMGVRIALDDFGVGYASLTYLRKLPLHTLKLDRSFIEHIGEQSAEHAIVKTMISLVHQLGFEVVAEGVETATQFQLLREWDCNLFQGYLLAPPMQEKGIGIHLMHSESYVFGGSDHVSELWPCNLESSRAAVKAQ